MGYQIGHNKSPEPDIDPNPNYHNPDTYEVGDTDNTVIIQQDYPQCN